VKVAQHITYVMRPTYRQPSEWVLCYVMLCYVMLCYAPAPPRRRAKKVGRFGQGSLILRNPDFREIFRQAKCPPARTLVRRHAQRATRTPRINAPDRPPERKKAPRGWRLLDRARSP
jgi:hypothetical protein